MLELNADAPLSAALDVLAQWCAQAALPFEAAWGPAIAQLGRTLAEAAARTNLVGDARPAALCEHMAEALAVAAAAQEALGSAPRAVVDIGAGAGLEALTLALCWPSARVVAVEPRKLRADFIAVAAREAGLGNVQVIQRTVASCCLGATFDLATARAVWPGPQWLERSRALLAPLGVTAIHGSAPSADLARSGTIAGWHAAAWRDVPGPRAHAVAVFRRADGAA